MYIIENYFKFLFIHLSFSNFKYKKSKKFSKNSKFIKKILLKIIYLDFL